MKKVSVDMMLGRRSRCYFKKNLGKNAISEAEMMEFGRNMMNLPWSPCLLTHFQSKSCTNLRESKFWRKKKELKKI